MKIRVPVQVKFNGSVTIDVPEGSPLLNDTASLLKKRRAARDLAEKAIKADASIIDWDSGNCTEDGFEVYLGYVIEEEGDK